MATAWRLARSLETLRNQVNTVYPSRNKASDGTIGDSAHQAQASDHNPNAAGVVTAMDITHDPASGCDVQKLADSVANSRDARVKYLIFNDHIMVPSDYGWKWVYHFAGSHRSHLHISVRGDYDSTAQWSITKGDTMVQNNDLDFNVLAQTFKNMTGRSLSRKEFQLQVGRNWQDVLVTFQGSKETAAFYKKATTPAPKPKPTDADKRLQAIKDALSIK